MSIDIEHIQQKGALPELFIRVVGTEDITTVQMIFSRALNTIDNTPQHIQDAWDDIRGVPAEQRLRKKL